MADAYAYQIVAGGARPPALLVYPDDTGPPQPADPNTVTVKLQPGAEITVVSKTGLLADQLASETASTIQNSLRTVLKAGVNALSTIATIIPSEGVMIVTVWGGGAGVTVLVRGVSVSVSVMEKDGRVAGLADAPR